MVFRYPEDPSTDFIKRVAGIPGDEVAYLNQKLTLNGQPVPVQPQGEFYDEDSMRYSPMFTEKLGAAEHRRALHDVGQLADVAGPSVRRQQRQGLF